MLIAVPGEHQLRDGPVEIVDGPFWIASSADRRSERWFADDHDAVGQFVYGRVNVSVATSLFGVTASKKEFCKRAGNFWICVDHRGKRLQNGKRNINGLGPRPIIYR